MSTLTQIAQARWSALAAREKSALLLAGAVVSLALLWWLLLAPALHTLRSAPAQHQALDAQLARMTRMATQAQALQAQPAVGAAERLRALELTLKPLGSAAQWQVTGTQATLTLRQVRPETLAQWLAQLRTQAQTQPVQVQLQRSASSTQPGSTNTAPAAGAASAGAATWDGTLVFKLPGDAVGR